MITARRLKRSCGFSWPRKGDARIQNLNPLYLIGQLFVLISLGCSLPCHAADEQGKIWLDLKLQDPADSTSAVISMPSRADVICDPVNSHATDIVMEILAPRQSIAAVPSDRSEDHSSSLPQIGQEGETFVENLKAILTARGFTFADGFEISDQAPPPKIRLGLDYTSFTPDQPPPVTPAFFQIWARTRLLPPDSPAMRWAIRDLAMIPSVQSLLRAQRGEAAATESLPNTPGLPGNFSLIILPAEGLWLRDLTEGAVGSNSFDPIFAVAVSVAEEVVRQRALEKPRTPANRDELASALHQAFASWPLAGEIAFNDELSAVDSTYGDAGTPAWVFRLTGFDPVQREIVSVDQIQLGTQGRQSWAAFVAHQQTAGKNISGLEAQKTTFEKKLSAWLTEHFPWGEPHFAASNDHAQRIAALAEQPGVAAVDPRVFRDTAGYSITWYPVLTTLEASGTYNSDRGGNISTRLAVQTRDFGLSAEAYLANRRRGIFADVTTTPKSTNFADHAVMTWGLLGEYTRENPIRLGTPEFFSLTDEESRAGVRWRLEGSADRAAKSQGVSIGNRNDAPIPSDTRRWKLEVIAGYRHARLSSENFNFVETSGGAAPFASTEFTGEWEHYRTENPSTIKSSAALFHTEVALDASPAHRTTSSFARGQFKGTGEFRIGSGRLENSLLRLTASGGAATDNTPVAWWYRLGGDERMRGFELGELAGRSFVHAAIEGGMSAGAFLPKRALTTSGAASPALPFDLRQIRILLGVEHAWIGDPPTLSPPAGVLRSGWSYSVIGEYAGAIPGLPGNSTLALGYGYAPRSTHRSGRVFLTLRVPLSLPQPH